MYPPPPTPRSGSIDVANRRPEHLVGNLGMYTYPLTAIIPRVRQKIRRHSCQILLIAGLAQNVLVLGPSTVVIAGTSTVTTPHQVTKTATVWQIYNQDIVHLNLHNWLLGVTHCNEEGTLRNGRWNCCRLVNLIIKLQLL